MNNALHDFDHSPRNAEEFLATYEDVDAKVEYVDGKVVVMMTNVTLAHYRTASRFVRQLAPLEDDGYLVGGADFGVQIDEDVRHPDVLVFRPKGLKDADRRTTKPILIGEVLSPATTHIDFRRKAEQYLGVETLQHYVVLAQAEPIAWVWSRDDTGRFEAPAVLRSEDDAIALGAFDLTIPLSAIYHR